KNLHVDLEVKTKGFAIVPKAPVTSRPPAETDSDDRARFENILSFRRKRESRPRRGVGAAGAVRGARAGGGQGRAVAPPACRGPFRPSARRCALSVGSDETASRAARVDRRP